MRVCDRHPDRKAADAVLVMNDDEHFDLCGDCKAEVMQFLTSQAEGLGEKLLKVFRPRRKTDQTN